MGVSDRIEAFILELMKQEQDDWLKIQRNELAQIFGCVPSQINYVISTRFSPERGYMVESKRGGGGCVKIRRIKENGQSFDTLHIGASVTEYEAVDCISMLLSDGKLSREQAQIILAAVSDKTLGAVDGGDIIRASIFKGMLSTVFKK